MENIDIIKTINEISQDEREKLKAFKARITEYCVNTKSVLYLFRVLKELELELNDCLTGLIHINVDRSVVVKVLRTIRIELEVIKLRIKNQGLMEFSESKLVTPLGEWTDDKLNLIELIYAIYKTKSINNGKITLKQIQECFEEIFQVKLGNISNRINEIDNRKGHDKLYLDILTTNLNDFLDEMNV